ncbi:HAMP domain-containing histidine kinase [Altererythrobacter sp. SALINAS58]|uniref:sensor histidine kinase n=1 Tax=Alteripontixanthobacter muriae TaxID=2705546 RepID=UPI001575B063|nr:HAMP domain-containing sensor histidine kinase [Alteripontixanthobacter muriae]NTZ41612.1 HAMP domain-containing histidine kinase [Alteripontixanthobacter muriae]
MSSEGPITASAISDAEDRLVEVQEPLAGLHQACGGVLPGRIAIPELLQLVRRSREYQLRLARTVQAFDGDEIIKFWAAVEPLEEAGGCRLEMSNWQTISQPVEREADVQGRRDALTRQMALLSARLDQYQNVLTVESHSIVLRDLAREMRSRMGQRWTDMVELRELPDRDDIHWRLLDGARLMAPGMEAGLQARLIPAGEKDRGSAGFELYFLPDEQAEVNLRRARSENSTPSLGKALGRELSPVLRRPVPRIIANAETIRSRLAGPLAEEYSNYAADIATAGQHLLSLIDDLADLEVVEDANFSVSPDQIDLAEVARQAAGILGVRAREKNIGITGPGDGEVRPAIGEFRRVLQILLNLLGNAIHYAPEGSSIKLLAGGSDDTASLEVADQGPGLTPDQQKVVFNKFERLGRSGDGGSGLGLYISRRLARAMRGELAVASEPGQGARFTLTLPTVETNEAAA